MIFNKSQGFYLRKLKPRYRMKDTYLDNTYEKELTITLIINYLSPVSCGCKPGYRIQSDRLRKGQGRCRWNLLRETKAAWCVKT